MDNQISSAAEEGAFVPLPDELVIRILSHIPITELEICGVNHRWRALAQKLDTFKAHLTLCQKYQEHQENCRHKLPSAMEAVDIISELRTLFSALPASKVEKSRLAKNFENKHSLPLILCSCTLFSYYNHAQEIERAAQDRLQKRERAVQDHFLILAMMRIHRECIGGPEQFIVDFTIHPLLVFVGPSEALTKTQEAGSQAFLAALYDRGCGLNMISSFASRNPSPENWIGFLKKISPIILKRGTDIPSNGLIDLANNISKYNNSTLTIIACDLYKKALNQGINNVSLTTGPGDVLIGNGCFEEGIKYHELFLLDNKSGLRLDMTLGMAHAQLNHVAQAAYYFKSFIDPFIDQEPRAGWIDYLAVKDVLIRDGAPQKYVDWVEAGINADQDNQ